MDYSLYNLHFRKFINARDSFEHYLYPSVNQHDFKLVNDGKFEIKVPCISDVNVLCGQYSVLASGEEYNDLAAQLLQQKNDWLKKLNKLGNFNNLNALRSLKKLRKGKSANISLELRQYLEHIKHDPITGFEGDRNWLFNGGTVVSVGNEDGGDEVTMVHPSGRGMSSLCARTVVENRINMDDAQTCLKMDQPILQISADPSSGLLCTRQKNNISILKRDGPHFKVVRKKKVAKSRYFTSVDMRRNVVAIARNVGYILLFDVQSNSLSYLRNISRDYFRPCTVGNSWSQIHWLDDQLVLVRNKKLTLADPRGGYGIDWNLEETLEECEDICNYFRSEQSSTSSYVATSHHLLHVDLRQQKTSHRWTHLMKNMPSYGQALKWNDGDELVMLQSQTGEAVLVGCGDDLRMVPPALVSGPADALRDAQLSGACLDPDVSRRVAFTTTGTHLITCGNKTRQVTQNAGGDVFVRDIVNADDKMADDSEQRVESWREFEMQAPRHVGRPAQSAIVDMTRAFDALHLPDMSRTTKWNAKPHWRMREQLSVDKLKKYKDTFVQPILEAWNITITDDEPDDEKDTDLLPSAEDKVGEWLMKHDMPT